MPLDVRHTKVSTVPDNGDPTLVQGPDWNAAHQLLQGPLALLGRADGATGQHPTVEVQLDATMQFAGGKLGAVIPGSSPPSGPAGGDLAGNYPNPTLVGGPLSNYAPLASPTFTGDPKAPTPATADNDTSIATTAFVKAQAYAPLASPTFTGDPKAPTAAPGDNDTSIATTAFVTAALGFFVPKTGGTMTGPLTVAVPGAVSSYIVIDQPTANTNRPVLILSKQGTVVGQISADGTALGSIYYEAIGASPLHDFFVGGSLIAQITSSGLAVTGPINATSDLGGYAVWSNPSSGASAAFHWNVTGLTANAQKWQAINDRTLRFQATDDSGTVQAEVIMNRDGTMSGNGMALNSQPNTYAIVASDAGKFILHGSAGAVATYTIPANASVPFPVGTKIEFVNASANALTIAITTDTLTLSPGGTTGSRTLAQFGKASALKIATTLWYIHGTGLT